MSKTIIFDSLRVRSISFDFDDDEKINRLEIGYSLMAASGETLHRRKEILQTVNTAHVVLIKNVMAYIKGLVSTAEEI